MFWSQYSPIFEIFYNLSKWWCKKQKYLIFSDYENKLFSKISTFTCASNVCLYHSFWGQSLSTWKITNHDYPNYKSLAIVWHCKQNNSFLEFLSPPPVLYDKENTLLNITSARDGFFEIESICQENK